MHCLTQAAALLFAAQQYLSLALALPTYSSGHSKSPTSTRDGPIVQVRNGTIVGRYVQSFNQDHFLGIPFAQPPTGSLRFAHPQSINKTWNGTLKAKEYGPLCIPYKLNIAATTAFTYPESEDCLTINVIRPAGTGPEDRLPVLVWIYGGGFREGGSGEGRYNTSALLQNGVDAGHPAIIVSFNYRLAGWGFLGGEAVRGEGSLNAALLDQRMALRWIQENIHAFGGDNKRVTIQGESAGAGSVGFQMLAYGGRDDGLFSAAIAQSGGPYAFAAYVPGEQQQSIYQSVLAATDCTGADDSLACLRAAPFPLLDAVFARLQFYPVVDGDFIQQHSSIALEEGNFVKVPLLIGANTDEGKLFMGYGANCSDEFRTYLSTNPYIPTSNNETIEKLMVLYPAQGSNSTHGQSDDTIQLPAPYGSQAARTARFVGDAMFTAGRRYAAEIWSKNQIPVYSYRFNTIPGDVDPVAVGASHFQEVAFLFNNVNMTGLDTGPFAVTPAERRNRYLDLSKLMTRMWMSFAATHDPNNHHVPSFNTSWPEYSRSASNLVFDADATSFVEKDDWRTAQLRFLIERSMDYGR